MSLGVKPKQSLLLVILFVFLIFSAKPQEFNERLEKRHEAKKAVVGQSKQAEFVRLMEEEVRGIQTHPRAQKNKQMFQLWLSG